MDAMRSKKSDMELKDADLADGVLGGARALKVKTESDPDDDPGTPLGLNGGGGALLASKRGRGRDQGVCGETPEIPPPFPPTLLLSPPPSSPSKSSLFLGIFGDSDSLASRLAVGVE
jgi:hypothetical protein